ncbi:MAG: LLM class F420-dependent oxidoreductase [Chloroflexi bacterium]|nr:LLM class F420-dependent oxidoreductase [Chloroflexota bacterium]
MNFGVVIFPTEYSIGVTDLARAVEDRGFESLLTPEHTHIPASRRTPWPGGADLPREYVHLLDPFVALTAAASVTRRLRVGTGICLIIQHDPIILAKQVSTLDLVSGGRFLFGIGAGWNREEMENHGTDPEQRWKLMRERVLAMKQIWTQEEASFHGQFVRFERIWQHPKPVQKPHAPIIVGGNGPRVVRRAAEYGDEWMPNVARGGGPLEERIAELQRLAAEAGRGPLPVTLFAVQPEPHILEGYRELGVARCLFMLPSAPADEVLPLVARYADLIRRFA